MARLNESGGLFEIEVAPGLDGLLDLVVLRSQSVTPNPPAGVAYFRNQIFTKAMSQGGDSGSLLLSRADQKATGLLFAGSPQVTVHHNIANVLMALDVDLITA